MGSVTFQVTSINFHTSDPFNQTVTMGYASRDPLNEMRITGTTRVPMQEYFMSATSMEAMSDLVKRRVLERLN